MMRRMSKKVGKLTGSLAAVLAIAAITGCGRTSKESKSIVSVSHSLRSMPLLITAEKGFWKD